LSSWTSPLRTFAHFPEESLFQSVSAFCYLLASVARTAPIYLHFREVCFLPWSGISIHLPVSCTIGYVNATELCFFYMSKSQKRTSEKTTFSQVIVYTHTRAHAHTHTHTHTQNICMYWEKYLAEVIKILVKNGWIRIFWNLLVEITELLIDIFLNIYIYILLRIYTITYILSKLIVWTVRHYIGFLQTILKSVTISILIN